MPPIVKENDISTARPETVQRPVPSGDSAIKQQPVALEVPVSVNGARAVEGSDKREPFSESTKTVLIFGNGAVIRLSSAVAPGQLLFLTNEKTKKEVVCQVVKSKNYRNVSGYVELEFTEPVVGFWGMRFPGDRIGSAPVPPVSSPVSSAPATLRTVTPDFAIPPAAVTPSIAAPKPAAPVSARSIESKLAASKKVLPEAPMPPLPAAPKPEDLLPEKPVAPVAPLSSKLASSFDPEAPLNIPAVPVVLAAPIAVAPEFPASSLPEKSSLPASVLFDSPRDSEAKASFLEPAKTPGVTQSPSLQNLLALFEPKVEAPAAALVPPAPPSLDAQAEALQQHTARLQEELSRMHFSDEAAAPSTVSVKIPHAQPVEIEKELAEKAAKFLAMSQIQEPEPAQAAPPEQVKSATPPAISSIEDDQLKIPAWLEPLARNAIAPSSTQELIEREKAKRLAEQPKLEEPVPPMIVPAEEVPLPELPVPSFGSTLPLDEVKPVQVSGSKSSGKFMLIGSIAAGVLLLAGGWWFTQQRSSGTPAGSSAVSNVEASVASLPVASAAPQPETPVTSQKQPSALSNAAAVANASARSSSNSNTLSVVPANATAATRKSPSNTNASNANAVDSTSSAAQPPAEQPKKPVLGDVHLAAPKLTPNKRAQNAGEPDAGIALTNDSLPEAGAEGLNAGLIGGSAQPSAPVAALPVGGDVKQARLISSVPPAYPILAKNQHVSGNVQVDALIDANGRVTTMKVVSGPTLLHQAAMDALKQWRYQPASLDGKPVAMHLTVTIQFRLQ
jgi:protein TonB